MGGNSRSSFTCKHEWKACKGVCPSCLAEKLVTITCSFDEKKLQSSFDQSTDMINQTTESCYEDAFTYFPVGASTDFSVQRHDEYEVFSWERSDSVGKAGLQHVTHPKGEVFFDATEDDHGLCLVPLDPGMIIDRGQYRKILKATGICRKDDGNRADAGPLIGDEVPPSQPSHQMDSGSKSGNKLKYLWLPSAIVRKLFSKKKRPKHPLPTHHPCEETSCLPSSHMMERIARENIRRRSSSMQETASLDQSLETYARYPQRSEAEKIHPLRRVMPVTSTRCYDWITDAMRQDHPTHKFLYQSFSNYHTNQFGSSRIDNGDGVGCSRAVWSKVMGSPLKILTKKSSSKRQGAEQCAIDLDKHFKGATSSWGKFSSLMLDPQRRLCYHSPTHNAFYKDHYPSSFRSSPMGRCRRRKSMASRHGILHLSPYSLGNDGWSCYLSPIPNRRSSSLKSRLI